MLLIVGGASGQEGDEEMQYVQSLMTELGVEDQVRFVEPQPHHILSTYYRAADVVLVPSRSESFGLVALEASACGIPVVASGVGGLLTLVDTGTPGSWCRSATPACSPSTSARSSTTPTGRRRWAGAARSGHANTRGALLPRACVACTPISTVRELVACA